MDDKRQETICETLASSLIWLIMSPPHNENENFEEAVRWVVLHWWRVLTTQAFNENENFEEAVMATMHCNDQPSEFLGEFHSNLKVAVCDGARYRNQLRTVY